MTDHTPEPWSADAEVARRIQACLDACAGIPTEQLENANFKTLIYSAEYLAGVADTLGLNLTKDPVNEVRRALAPFRDKSND